MQASRHSRNASPPRWTGRIGPLPLSADDQPIEIAAQRYPRSCESCLARNASWCGKRCYRSPRDHQRITWSTWRRETAKQAFERLQAPAWPWAAKGKHEPRPSSPFAAIALLLGRATQVALGGPAISVAVPNAPAVPLLHWRRTSARTFSSSRCPKRSVESFGFGFPPARLGVVRNEFPIRARGP